MTVRLQEVDRVEILTLQDNMIDIAAADGRRGGAARGFGGRPRQPGQQHPGRTWVLGGGEPVRAGSGCGRALFDFGFSETGALQNARTLGVDLAGVSALVLSHGHSDHHGGLPAVLRHIGRKGIELVVHPAAFRCSRYLKVSEERMIRLTTPDRERLEAGRGQDRRGGTAAAGCWTAGCCSWAGSRGSQRSKKGLARARYRDEAGRETFEPGRGRLGRGRARAGAGAGGALGVRARGDREHGRLCARGDRRRPHLRHHGRFSLDRPGCGPMRSSRRSRR